MNEKILVFNAGSTSLKYKLFSVEKDGLDIIKQGIVENIGSPYGPKNHTIALSILFKGFGVTIPYLGKIDNLVAIGHRVTYGGNEFRHITQVNNKIILALKKYNSLAPLHNPVILDVMQDIVNHSGKDGHRDIPNYAVFDSSFFKELPEVAKIYPLPYSFYSEHGIQRFGFHGLSHSYVSEVVSKNYPSCKKIISLHLGAGASITAIENGIPIDTSMGFSPREGLMMTTRSGDIDPGIVFHLLQSKIAKNYQEVDEIINYKSGLAGISDIGSDMRDILFVAGYKVEDDAYKPHSSFKNPDKETVDKAKLAIAMYCYHAIKYIGAYYSILGGCDILVFTGSIGYRSSVIRSKVIEKLGWMSKETRIIAINTDEEMQIAKDIMSHLKLG